MTSIRQAQQAVQDAAARAEFYRLWHAAQRMGATHERALDMMGARTTSSRTEALRAALLHAATQRQTMTDALAQYHPPIQPFEKALLEFGEEAGSLDQTLRALGAHFEAEHRLLRKLWSKLTYPLITSLAMIFIAPLPLVFSNQTGAYAVSVMAGVGLWYGLGGGPITALAAAYANRRNFVLARLARTIAGAIEAGLPTDRAARMAADATGHPALMAHVRKRTAAQIATMPLSQVFEGCTIVPPEMIAALRVAETTGDFSGSLRKLADLYDIRDSD